MAKKTRAFDSVESAPEFVVDTLTHYIRRYSFAPLYTSPLSPAVARSSVLPLLKKAISIALAHQKPVITQQQDVAIEVTDLRLVRLDDIIWILFCCCKYKINAHGIVL